MNAEYLKYIEGLESTDPETALVSAVWVIENPEQIEDPSLSVKASNLLYFATMENIECLHYIDEHMVKQVTFKAQLLASLYKEGTPPEMKGEAEKALSRLIEQVAPLKSKNTELVAEIYTTIQETAHTPLLEKIKKLL